MNPYAPPQTAPENYKSLSFFNIGFLLVLVLVIGFSWSLVAAEFCRFIQKQSWDSFGMLSLLVFSCIYLKVIAYGAWQRRGE